ncbi:MAG: hypothetical protein ACJAU9_000521 [Lentimonas sp.]|jgi:hypothetical protein
MARQKKKDKRFQIKPVRCKQHGIELPKNGHGQREFQKAKAGAVTRPQTP